MHYRHQPALFQSHDPITHPAQASNSSRSSQGALQPPSLSDPYPFSCPYMVGHKLLRRRATDAIGVLVLRFLTQKKPRYLRKPSPQHLAKTHPTSTFQVIDRDEMCYCISKYPSLNRDFSTVTSSHKPSPKVFLPTYAHLIQQCRVIR